MSQPSTAPLPLPSENPQLATARHGDENPLIVSEYEPATALRKRQRLTGAVATTAVKLLPLVNLLDKVQAQDSVFHTRRQRLRSHLALAYKELRAERPRHHALAHAFKALAEVVREETRDISPDEVKQAAKEVVLATLKNAPALLNAAHQAQLLS